MSSSQCPQQASSSSAQERAQEDSRKDKENLNNTFDSHIHGGKVVSGSVSGGIVVQGDYYAAGQAPTTSTSTPSQPSAENWKQKLEM
uniref:Uncharacterized protein n=1 Tax=Plectus sambesii TaxID=2011161 RepID=A0A914X3D8_9BILA